MPKEKAVSVSSHIDPKDFSSIAESIIQEWTDRKKRRGDLEKHWDEIDRQLRMQPELSHKTDVKGKVIKGMEWLPEIELPLQAQTLEILTADVRRLLLPNDGDSFTARSGLAEQ